MRILVQDKVIETRNIANIIDIEANKKYFLNREAGFTILFSDNTTMVFKENIPYESYPNEIATIKEKWRKLMDEVTKQWKADCDIFKEFKLD